MMPRVPALRLRLLALGVVGAAIIGVVWTTAAASQSANDSPDEPPEPSTPDELLSRFPIGTEPVTESPEPPPPPAAASPQRAASGSEWRRIAVLAAAAVVVLLVAVNVAASLRRRREPSATKSTPGLAQNLDASHAELDAALAELARLAEAPIGGSAPVREHTDQGAAVLTTMTTASAANGGGPQGVEELDGRLVAGESDYIERNAAAWERWAPEHARRGREAWQEPDLHWGIWGTPESALRIFEGLEPGADVVELGCGTAAVSAWLARQGARPVAIDIAPTQLRTAETLQREFGLSFPLIRANAERLQFDGRSFDLAVSEYGASLWCDPQRWLAEAYRLLRPDGRLVFFTNGALLMACTPDDGGPARDRLVRDYFSSSRVEFREVDAVEFHPTHGEWVRLLRATGFMLEDLIEVRPSLKAKAAWFEFASVEWARRWPSEEIWVARKPA